jgi:hypothetical protein
MPLPPPPVTNKPVLVRMPERSGVPEGVLWGGRVAYEAYTQYAEANGLLGNKSAPEWDQLTPGCQRRWHDAVWNIDKRVPVIDPANPTGGV